MLNWWYINLVGFKRFRHMKIYAVCLQPYPTPRSRVLLEKLPVPQLAKKLPAFYGTGRVITAVTSACHLSLYWSTYNQFMSPTLSAEKNILIFSFHLRLGLPSGLYPSDFHRKILYASLFSPVRVTCPCQLNLLHFITRKLFGEV